MRTIGTAILLPLLALFGFGFLLSHSLNLTQELATTRSQLARMQAEMQTLKAQYQSLLEEKNRLIDRVSGLTGENTGLHARVETLEAERLALLRQIDTQQRKLAFVEQANLLLSSLITSARGRLAALLVLPIVPLSFGAVYVMTHAKTTSPPVIPTKGRGPGQTTYQAALTREELHLIAQHRKGSWKG